MVSWLYADHVSSNLLLWLHSAYYQGWTLCNAMSCATAGPGSSKLGLRTTAAIIFARLVLVPPVGLGIVMLADKLGFLPAGDKMFRFVLLLQHTMPTSVLAGIAQFSSLDKSLNKFLRTGTKILQNIDTYHFWRHFEQPRISLTIKPFLGCWKLTQLIFLFSPNC